MSKVIQVHTNEPDVLPHCFAAISNLVANHEPNQVVAGSGGVIKAAIECLTIYQNHSMMCLTIQEAELSPLWLQAPPLAN